MSNEKRPQRDGLEKRVNKILAKSKNLLEDTEGVFDEHPIPLTELQQLQKRALILLIERLEHP